MLFGRGAGKDQLGGGCILRDFFFLFYCCTDSSTNRGDISFIWSRLLAFLSRYLTIPPPPVVLSNLHVGLKVIGELGSYFFGACALIDSHAA